MGKVLILRPIWTLGRPFRDLCAAQDERGSGPESIVVHCRGCRPEWRTGCFSAVCGSKRPNRFVSSEKTRLMPENMTRLSRYGRGVPTLEVGRTIKRWLPVTVRSLQLQRRRLGAAVERKGGR